MQFAKRAFAILFSFLVACYVAGAVMMVFMFALLAHESSPTIVDAAGAPSSPGAHLGLIAQVLVTFVVVGGLYAGVVVAIIALVPAGAVIAYAESAARRNLGFYLAAGAILGPFGCLAVFGVSPDGAGDAQPLRFLVPLFGSLVAGTLATLVYWALAGHRAGAWRGSAIVTPGAKD